jgi:single-stranded-DNA-specific exonuclease
VLSAPRLEIAACDAAAAYRLQRELGVSAVLAQVLVRRGFAAPAAARAWIAADDRHDLAAFGGLAEAAALVRRHVAAGTRVVVHGDYDVDGMASTARRARSRSARSGS